MKLILLSIAALAASAFTSCNTTIGLGRDMRILGEGMENSANKQSGGTQDTSGAPVY